MKLNLPGVLLIFIGVILLYSSAKDKDPRNVVLEALGSKRRVPDPTEGRGDITKPITNPPDTGMRPPDIGIGPIVSV